MILNQHALNGLREDNYGGGPLTFRLNVVAKNHPFSAFLSATKSRFFVRKDNDLIFFLKIRPENDNDPKKAKFCPDISDLEYDERGGYADLW